MFDYQLLPMTTIASLLQETRILVLLVIILLMITLNQYLWHKRQMQIIKNFNRVQPGAKLPSQLPQVTGIGLVLTVVGIGSLIEAYFLPEADGGIILTGTGSGILIFSAILYCTSREKSDNNG